MTITEEQFKKRFLEKFKLKKYSDEEFLNRQLNDYMDEDFYSFLYHFLKDNNLPMEIHYSFPWTRYFKGYGLYRIEQNFKKWRGRKYDKYYFEPEQPFYYETLKNHLFDALERINDDGHHCLKTTISERCFRESFLDEFPKFRSKSDRLSSLALNSVDEIDCQLFFYQFLLENDLPLKIHFSFPWKRYFKRGFLYGLKERIKKWRGLEYDKDFLKPEELLYYATLRDHLFVSLEKLKSEKQTQ